MKGGYFNRYGIFWISASYTAGSLLCFYYFAQLSSSFFFSLLLSSILCVGTFILVTTHHYRLLLICLLITLIGIIQMHQHHHGIRFKSPFTDPQLGITVRIDGIRKVNDNKISYIVQTIRSHLRYYMWTDADTPLQKGDIISLRGRYHPPESRTNPGLFDYQWYLYTQGISGTLLAKNIEKVGYEAPFILIRWGLWLRNTIKGHFNQLSASDLKDLLWSMIFGVFGTQLDLETKESYRQLGLSHLLVASGSQVNLLTSGIMSLSRLCHFPLRFQVYLIGLFHFFLLLITGADVAITRSIMMNQLILIHHLFQRSPSILHIWMLSYLALSLVTPLTVFNIGAQLSLLAGLSMISLVPMMAERLPQKWPTFCRELLSLAVIPTLMTAPILWFHFSEFSWLAIPSNLIILPFVDLMVITGVLGSVLSLLFQPIAFSLLTLSSGILIVINYIVTKLSALPYPIYSLPTPPLFLIILIYLAIFWLIHHRFHIKALFQTVLFIGLLFSGFLITSYWPSSELSLYFLDVGQGDAILIQTPQKRYYLVDAGLQKTAPQTGKVTVDMGKTIVLPSLRRLGVNSIQALFISHYDKDHSGGVPSVIKGIKTHDIIDNGQLNNSEFKRLSPTLSQFKIPTHRLKPLQEYTLEKDLTLTCLWPLNALSMSSNNQSIVMKLRYKEVSILFTGDIEKETETILAQTYPQLLKSTILKVGHHGSKTSSSPYFLAQVSPKASIIQVGRNNHYSHPNPQVLERLKAYGSVFRTDQQGQISLKTNGKTFYIRSFLD